jgi:double-strand break repair protein MRE11
MSQDDNPDMFRILVASDIHLGYNEKDHIRGEDSFNAFEELMKIAVERKVDFVLLGGDLFHDNKPSPKSMFQASETLRKYVFGDGDIRFELISDQTENFSHTKNFPHVNFEDENLNVSLPVFTIHGNHDDPTGKNPMTYLETLAATGLVNYFGKYMDMKKIDVRPLLLRKGKTHLALYGLGSLPEERLHRLFERQHVRFLRPMESTDNWFNVFVVHQNRNPHGKKYMPEKFLTTLPHVVIWGHEHECKTEPDFNQDYGFHVLQPGSTVCTALCESEALPKHVFLMEIFQDDFDANPKFKVEPIPLKSVRQYYFEHMDLDEELKIRNIPNNEENSERIQRVVSDKIQSLLDQAELEREDGQPSLPLIRLRLESQHTMQFHEKTFGTHFQGKVANPDDIILFRRKVVKKTGEKVDFDKDVLESLISTFDLNEASNIEDLVDEYFLTKEDTKGQLNCLPERSITLKVKDMVVKEMDGSGIQEFVDSIQQNCKDAMVANIDLDAIDDEKEIKKKIQEFRAKTLEKDRKTDKALVKELLAQSSNGHSFKGSEYFELRA